jgi:hypothetical protein
MEGGGCVYFKVLSQRIIRLKSYCSWLDWTSLVHSILRDSYASNDEHVSEISGFHGGEYEV